MSYKVGKNKPPKHTRWKPGESGNPEGSRRHNQGMKRLRRDISPNIDRIIATLLLCCTRADVVKILKDPREPVIKAMIAGIINKGLRGNVRAFEALLTRVIGPPRNTPLEIVKPDSVLEVSEEEMLKLNSDPKSLKAVKQIEMALSEMRAKAKAEFFAYLQENI